MLPKIFGGKPAAIDRATGLRIEESCMAKKLIIGQLVLEKLFTKR